MYNNQRMAETVERIAGGEILYTLFETYLCGHTVALTADAFVEGSIHWNRSVTDGALQLGTVISASLTASIRNSAKLWVSDENGHMVESQYKLWQIEDLQRSLDPSAAPTPLSEVFWTVSEHLGVAEARAQGDDYGYSTNTLVTGLGIFYIYSLTDGKTQYDLQAYDGLIKTDKPVDWTLFTNDMTFADYVDTILSECDLGSINSTVLSKYNHATTVVDAHELKDNQTYGITTYRQLLCYIAQVFGKVFYIDRLATPKFGWAFGARSGSTVGTISPSNRFSFTAASGDVKIAGWKITEGTFYPSSSDHDGLIMGLSENVLTNRYLTGGETPSGGIYIGWRDGNLDPTYLHDTVFVGDAPIKYRPFEASILCDLRYDPLDPVALEIVREVDDDPAHDETVTVYSYILENNITINGEQVVRCPDYVNNDSGNESYFTAGENKEINAAAGNVFDNSFGSAFNTAFSTAFSAAIADVISAELPVVDAQNPQNTRTSGYVQIGPALFQYGWVSLRTTTTSAENFWITMPKHFDDLLYGLSLVPRVGKPDAVSLSEAPTSEPNERLTNKFRVAITRTNSVSTGTNTTVFWAAYGKASTTQA